MDKVGRFASLLFLLHADMHAGHFRRSKEQIRAGIEAKGITMYILLYSTAVDPARQRNGTHAAITDIQEQNLQTGTKPIQTSTIQPQKKTLHDERLGHLCYCAVTLLHIENPKSGEQVIPEV